MSTRSIPLFLALLSAAASLVFATVAAAHPGWFFGTTRYNLNRGNVPVYFDRQTPTGAFRERFKEAFNRWEAVTPKVGFTVYASTAPQVAPDKTGNYRDCARTRYRGDRISLVSYQFIDGKKAKNDTYGTLAACQVMSNGTWYNDFFYLKIDTANDFYFGSGDAPRSQIDLGSVASHEVGHAVGFRLHYENTDIPADCDNSSEQETMCGGYVSGSERMRTLEGHDKHTYRNAYP